MPSRRAIAASVACVVVVAAAGIAMWRFAPVDAAKQATSQQVIAKTSTLYCDFFDFTHTTTVASFAFSVETPGDPQPRYVEEYEVARDGTTTAPDGSSMDYRDAGKAKPVWSYTVAEDAPTIKSPVNTASIKLYGLKPKASGVFWVEAGLRGDDYKNLEGKCQQAYFGSIETELDKNPK